MRSLAVILQFCRKWGLKSVPPVEPPNTCTAQVYFSYQNNENDDDQKDDNDGMIKMMARMTMTILGAKVIGPYIAMH